MPWMIFYQQSAVLDKGLTHVDLEDAKTDTLVGVHPCITRLISAWAGWLISHSAHHVRSNNLNCE